MESNTDDSTMFNAVWNIPFRGVGLKTHDVAPLRLAAADMKCGSTLLAIDHQLRRPFSSLDQRISTRSIHASTTLVY
jgi:hypothetical protein